jgi:AT-rich interactive domain-containing protein 2
MKVNSKNEWSEIEKEIGFPEKCVNSELALKFIYLRFFDKYERFNFLGEEKERIDEDEEESRHKRWSARALHSIPQSYNHSSHNISESVRVSSKLSTDLYQPSEYDKLTLSLLSPLPNEQDFSINVLTLMSNECKQTLRLGKCPRLISILLAHAGIFEHFNLREMFREFYAKVRGHSQDQFWNDLLVEQPDLTDLLYEDGLTNEDVFLDEEMMKQLYGDKDKIIQDIKDFPFLCLSRGLGTQDYIGQRVHQVASIIRNLSFFDENVSILARNRTLTRFLVLMANVRWNNLHMSALDVLGNIAAELELKDPFSDLSSRHIFGTVCDGIEGSDRGVIISCMEILSKLCQNEANEEFLLKYLTRKNYEQVCVYLLVQDMMLLIYTLECVYSLTSLGEKACNSIVDIHGLMDTLVSMVTIEAQSLGPDSCIQMKVVETVPARMMSQPQQRQAPQNVMQRGGNIPDQQRTMMYPSPSKFVQPSMESPSRAEQLLKQNQQQMIQENEQFALAWLRNNFELSPSLMVKIEEQDMYRMYVNACTKVGRKGALSQMHFPRCVRSVFGGSVGPNPGNSDASGDKQPMYYCGIKPRATMMQNQPEHKTEMIVIHPPKPSSPASMARSEESALIAQLSGKTVRKFLKTIEAFDE